MKIQLGQHKELAQALREKRGDRSKAKVAKEIGIGIPVLNRLESLNGNTSMTSQWLAREWLNKDI